jgi:alpha-tubulin suppressor-like RCC1 family protein
MAVSGLTGVTAISAGLEHALALLDDGSVVSWGNDNSGQLGDGIEGTSSDAPVSVTGLSESVSAVSAGLDHSLALLADGTVVAWGDDGSGELGNGSHTSTDSPVPVSNLTNVTSISAGSNFSLALSAGLVYTWGLDGTTLNNVPVEEKRVRGYIAAISAGGDHSLALTGQRPAMATARPVGGRLGMKAVLQGIRVPPTHAQRGLSHRSATVDRRTRFR